MISGDRPSDGESGTSRLDFRFYSVPRNHHRPSKFISNTATSRVRFGRRARFDPWLNAAESAGTPPACVL